MTVVLRTGDRDTQNILPPRKRVSKFWILLLHFFLFCLLFYGPLENISLIWWRHYSLWRDVRFRFTSSANGSLAKRDLYRDRRPRFLQSRPKNRSVFYVTDDVFNPVWNNPLKYVYPWNCSPWTSKIIVTRNMDHP